MSSIRGFLPRWLLAIAILGAVAAVVYLLGRFLQAKGLIWAANVSNIVSVFFAAMALLAPGFSRLLRWLRGPAPISRISIPQGRDDLAATLAAEWDEEERLRRVNDPRPLPVRWEVTTSALEATASAANATVDQLDGQFEEILSLFQRLSPSRLVILGAAGAGKSVLVIKLARDLLAGRQGEMPVPVIIPAAAWDPDTDLPQWIADQLCRNHPGLAQRIKDVNGRVTTLAFALVAERSVLPIIDGFDELPEVQREKAIEKINKFGSDSPIVLTSRPEEYLDALESIGRGISLAAVVELLPLQIEQAKDYLNQATSAKPSGRWDDVFDRLDSEPDGMLADVLCTPLMLWLARTVYESSLRDPVELADCVRFDSTEVIEQHLLDAFIPTVYAQKAIRFQFHCQSRHAERWLGFLASDMQRNGESSVAWWRLIRATPIWQAVYAGLRTVLFINLVWLIVDRLLKRHGHWQGKTYVRSESWRSFLLNGPLGRKAQPALEQVFAYTRRKIYHDMHTFMADKNNTPINHFVPWVSLADFEGVAISLGIVASVYAAMTFLEVEGAILPKRISIAPTRLILSSLGEMILNSVFAACVIFAVFLLFKPPRSALVPAGFLAVWSTYQAVGAYSVLGGRRITSSMVTLLDISRSVSPAEALRLDRHATRADWVLRRAFGAMALWLWAGSEVAISYGFLAAIFTLIRIVFGGTTSAVQGYTAARLWLWLSGRMPWRIMSFLEDAHRRGALRQVGAVYQFRHVRLQERLAATHPPWTLRAALRAIVVTRSLITHLIGSVALGLAVFLDDEKIIAADDKAARERGWQITEVRKGLRSYRDPRFDAPARSSINDAEKWHVD